MMAFLFQRGIPRHPSEDILKCLAQVNGRHPEVSPVLMS